MHIALHIVEIIGLLVVLGMIALASQRAKSQHSTAISHYGEPQGSTLSETTRSPLTPFPEQGSSDVP